MASGAWRPARGVRRVLNAIGAPTIVGANVAAPEVISVVDEVLRVNVEIDELQRAASRVIARWTGAEAGCVTSSCSAGLAVTAAAAMTGADLAKIVQLPDAAGLPNEVVLQAAHDVNFGAQVSRMIRLSGARPVLIGAANHCDAFHLRGALGEQTAAVLYVVTGAVNPDGDYLSLEQCVEIAGSRGVPVIVDAAAELDVRPFVSAGASLVITSGHKMMGAPTSGMICGRKELIRACYLQNWGIGRAMKVGKEGIAGCMAAVEGWYSRDEQADARRFDQLAGVFSRGLPARHVAGASRLEIDASSVTGRITTRQLANLLREGDPPIWVADASDDAGGGHPSPLT
jgi:D-glucosaminate-6-phosphate ammonia-lyase